MTKQEFIYNVIDEITEGGSIPVKPKADRIDKIIKNAIRKFRDNDDRAVEHGYLIIRKEIFDLPLFKEQRRIQLPNCVKAVTFLRTLGHHHFSNNPDPDYQKTNYSYAAALAGNADAMTTAVGNTYYNEYLRHFILKGITYSFNEYTHCITVEGRNPQTDLCAEIYTYVPDEAMYEIDDFFEYVCGKCQISFANVVGFTTRKLIGNTEINFDEIRSNGKERIDAVIERWQDQRNNVDFWIDDIY
jgi:hypothetical protein